ncbi:uncharacterized protein LOC121980123 [Zingiber officinale]|uniref:uncharacterized protein LOC121980123 n=1 Tax=Zingiber officinale TaxID=94328 RepID=UPI001C4CF681|nr:uncharacterized protein LOC121980123 [Zingiber officinale]
MVYKKGTMCDNSIDDKGSCSVKLQPMIEDDMKNDDDDLQILCQADVLQGKPVALTLESSTNIVAHGTIVCGNESDKMLQGVPFPNNCMRSIDEAVRIYISVSFDYDVFDDDYELVLHLEDIIPLYHLEPLSGNCVVGYIWFTVIYDNHPFCE